MKYLSKCFVAIIILVSLSSAQQVWQKHQGNPVIENIVSAAPNAGSQSIIEVNDTLKMWYTVKTGDGWGVWLEIRHAWSLDGVVWELDTLNSPVLGHCPRVHYNGNQYTIWFLYGDGIHRSWSDDGIHWDEDSISLIMETGSESEWDNGISSFTLLASDSGYIMWYSGYSLNFQENIQVGLATSADGINWTKDSSNPILTTGQAGSWDDCSVQISGSYYDGTTYEAWYTGSSWSEEDAAIGYLISDTSTSWNRGNEEPVLVGTLGAWDQGAIDWPFVLKSVDDPLYRLWYRASNGDIGYALSLDGYGGIVSLDADNSIVRVRYEGDSEVTLFAGFYSEDSLVNEVQLFDDGLHEDLLAADSIYGSPFSELLDGDYSVGIACYLETNLIIDYVDQEPLTIGGLDAATSAIPVNFELKQNYPNPFNPTTTISYDLSTTSDVILAVSDITGRTITTLIGTHQPAGTYSIQWNGKDDAGNQVSTGVYFARLDAGEFSQTIKMLYLK